VSADSCAKLSSVPTPLGARLELYVGRIDGRVRFWTQRTTTDGARTTVYVDSTRRAEEYYRAAEEHPDWHASEAQAFCSALKERCIRRLPGWDDAPWEVTSPDAFLAAEAKQRDAAGWSG